MHILKSSLTYPMKIASSPYWICICWRSHHSKNHAQAFWIGVYEFAFGDVDGTPFIIKRHCPWFTTVCEFAAFKCNFPYIVSIWVHDVTAWWLANKFIIHNNFNTIVVFNDRWLKSYIYMNNSCKFAVGNIWHTIVIDENDHWSLLACTFTV